MMVKFKFPHFTPELVQLNIAEGKALSLFPGLQVIYYYPGADVKWFTLEFLVHHIMFNTKLVISQEKKH